MENDEQVQTVESSTTGHQMTASESGDPLRNLTDSQRDTWLQTGELPSDKKEAESSETAKKTDGDSTSKKASSSDAPRAEETAEGAEKKAVESATTDEQEPEEKGGEAQKRIKELAAETKSLKARLAQLERPPAKAEPAGGDTKVSETKAEVKPEPKAEDYETLDEYIAAKIEWGVDQGLSKADQKRAEAAAKTELESKQREAQDRLNKTFDHGKKSHADFEEKALDPDLKILEGSVFDRWLMDPDMTPETRAELMYHYGTHREDLNKLNAMTPFNATRELTRLEATLQKPPASSKADSKPAADKKVSAAPPPGSEVGSKGSPTEDPRAKAIADGDAAAYMELENRRELAAKGGSRK